MPLGSPVQICAGPNHFCCMTASDEIDLDVNVVKPSKECLDRRVDGLSQSAEMDSRAASPVKNRENTGKWRTKAPSHSIAA